MSRNGYGGVSRILGLSAQISLAFGALGCGAFHEDQALFCSDPCPSGYYRDLYCNCIKRAEDEDSKEEDDSFFRGVFLFADGRCTPEGEQVKILNNTNRARRVRVQTANTDAFGSNTYTYAWYQVAPNEQKFVGCKVHLRRSFTIVEVELAAASRGPTHDRVIRVAALGSAAELLQSPAVVFAVQRSAAGSFVLTASSSPDCRHECLGEGYRCSQVSKDRLRDWRDGLAHFYSRSTDAAKNGGSVSAATLASLFNAAKDPCERGDLIFRDGIVYNEGRDCTLKGKISLSQIEAAFEIDLPGRIEGNLAAGQPRAVFPDAARAPEIRFPSNEAFERRYGGQVSSITLAEGSVLIGFAERCVALSASH